MASQSHPVAYEEQPLASTEGRYGSAHSTSASNENQAAYLRISSPCRHRCSEPIFLDTEVRCPTIASVSVLLVVSIPVSERSGKGEGHVVM